mgnify:CR=1 FL=1
MFYIVIIAHLFEKASGQKQKNFAKTWQAQTLQARNRRARRCV